MSYRVFVHQRLSGGPYRRGGARSTNGPPFSIKVDGQVIRNSRHIWHLTVILRVSIIDAICILPGRASIQATVATATAPAIITLEGIQTIRPHHLMRVVVLTIDRQLCASDSHCPRITGGKAHGEVSKSLVGKRPTVAAGNEYGHMLHLCQLSQATIEDPGIVG